MLKSKMLTNIAKQEMLKTMMGNKEEKFLETCCLSAVCWWCDQESRERFIFRKLHQFFTFLRLTAQLEFHHESRMNIYPKGSLGKSIIVFTALLKFHITHELKYYTFRNYIQPKKARNLLFSGIDALPLS